MTTNDQLADLMGILTGKPHPPRVDPSAPDHRDGFERGFAFARRHFAEMADAAGQVELAAQIRAAELARKDGPR